jgi:hypothetical protein
MMLSEADETTSPRSKTTMNATTPTMQQAETLYRALGRNVDMLNMGAITFKQLSKRNSEIWTTIKADPALDAMVCKMLLDNP